MNFTNNEKAKMFDKISEHFYNRNFGTFSKSDMELLMFSFFMDKLIEQNKNTDNTINYNTCSDYKISKELGITQQRVRNLKVKKQLVYPTKFDWKQSLALLTENARYDNVTHKISINIPDPNLFYEIQNFIEEQGGYIEVQLNSKLLQIRAEYYLALAIEIEAPESKKEIKKRLKKILKKNNKDEQSFKDKEVGKIIVDLVSIGANITSILADISDLMNPSNCLVAAIKKLFTKKV